MRITLAYNLRTELTEEEAELIMQEDIDRLYTTLCDLKHTVCAVEVSGKPNEMVDKLLDSEPDLIFNVAEGTIGSSRESFYPAVYEQLGIPFTGGNASLLSMNLDKNLAKAYIAARGIKVPRGVFVTPKNKKIPKDLHYPLMIKPNYEGSSKGITQDSVVETPEKCREMVDLLLSKYPAGLIVEEFIPGKELSVPFLEGFPGQLLEIVEHTFDLNKINGRYNIYDYDMKQGGESSKCVGILCPPNISEKEHKKTLAMARDVFAITSCPDLGRVDIRLHENGTPYFIELNPLPCLHPAASMMTGARSKGLDYKDVIRLVIQSAAKRYNIPLKNPKRPVIQTADDITQRPTAREIGISVGRISTGVYNSITDVKGVKVGHVTHIKNDVKIPGIAGKSHIRTGVTAILPSSGDIFNKRLVAGGYVLNGIGEMSGLTQVMEWGMLETPILLTNSHSVGKVHTGVINYQSKMHPNTGIETDVILPVVGETDDSFLNDIRIGANTAQDAVRAIESAKSGKIEQGSVGAGTGMITCDFAGGIGTSSRVIEMDEGVFTLGVLVLSNFGRMVNLTIDGKVAGRELDPLFSAADRRTRSYGSIIVVVATDAPLLSSQLCRISKRAALGIGRAGSHAASTSGEIIIAFSTANKIPRVISKSDKFLNIKFITDPHINMLYEAAVEATEEAIMNAIFCSGGMTGRCGRFSPAIPHDKVIEILNEGRNINACY